MDILIHILSGTATASVIAAQTDFSTIRKSGLVLLGGFAAALPDIDAISLWSGFDSIIGSALGLNHSGHQIYFSKFWYSHHGFFHSFFAALMIALLYVLIRKAFFRTQSFKEYLRNAGTQVSFAVFCCAYLAHLAGDLPTPGGPWGGIRLFFPFDVYVGGWGYIWWWNNYDVFLGLVALNALLFLLLIIPFQKGPVLKRIALFVYISGICITAYSITNRMESFAYSGNTTRYQYYEKVSRRDQLRILGKSLYVKMRNLDKNLPVHF